MKKNSLIFIKHILEHIELIEKFSEGLTKNEIEEDRLKQSAIVRELEIVGEAAKNLSIDFKDKYKEIEWKKIAGLRDKLIHNYFGVDLDIVWDIIIEDIPILKKQIQEIIKKEERKNEK